MKEMNYNVHCGYSLITNTTCLRMARDGSIYDIRRLGTDPDACDLYVKGKIKKKYFKHGGGLHGKVNI